MEEVSSVSLWYKRRKPGLSGYYLKKRILSYQPGTRDQRTLSSSLIFIIPCVSFAEYLDCSPVVCCELSGSSFKQSQHSASGKLLDSFPSNCADFPHILSPQSAPPTQLPAWCPHLPLAGYSNANSRFHLVL